jgi:(E)-4-hydroxy-3-methylbut-2-enyl-diphosphate synthase
MQLYCESISNYKRLPTKEVKVGDLALGNNHPIRVQTMTTTDTMDTAATVAQTIRCIEAGAEMVRITAPSKKEAENLLVIKNELRKQGFTTPLVADIHFTPNAAEIAARLIEKVRVNPGNYIDKKKFEQIEYTDHEYAAEIDRIRQRFTPLVKICKEYGTAMRIGTNHGSLSDRIMSRYGDTPMGMVESAMEFLRIARDQSYHNIVLSMKASNPLVMVQAYRLLIQSMVTEFGESYPLHLGVTEAGDGEDGRIKSAIGIGSLLEDGIGDTIRVSLTEDPEFEIPVCNDLVKRYQPYHSLPQIPVIESVPYSPFSYQRRVTGTVQNIGSTKVPVVIASIDHSKEIHPQQFQSFGYTYDEQLDKWKIADAAADYVYIGSTPVCFEIPGTLRLLADQQLWSSVKDNSGYVPYWEATDFLATDQHHPQLNFVHLSVEGCLNHEQNMATLQQLTTYKNITLVLSSPLINGVHALRTMIAFIQQEKTDLPIILKIESKSQTPDEHLIHFATEAGALLLEGMGDGIWLTFGVDAQMENLQAKGRTYLPVKDIYQFTNNTAFSILQATRTRISKTEYISCPSCGRTLFDLQETTAKIRSVTNHLKGVKIAIMGCIVNGPGEMADADFGYVGSGPGKITLYKGKEVVKRNVDSNIAVEELIELLKENEAWIDPA